MYFRKDFAHEKLLNKKTNMPNVNKINLIIKNQNAFANFDNAFYTQ